MMTMRLYQTAFTLLAVVLCGPASAQEMLLPATQEEESQPHDEQQPAPTEIVSEAEQTLNHLPIAEQRLRKGMVMLHSLMQTMAGIKDKDTAEAAVPGIMRFTKAFPAWAQSFNSLPPMEEMEQIIYEDQYLPLIEELNKVIKMHAERLAAAEYYGSTHLLTALIHLALINQ